MTKDEAQKTLEKMQKASNACAKIVILSKALLKDFGCVGSKGITYAVKIGWGKYIK